MRESTKKFLRITKFSFGVVLMIMGTISGSYALVKIPDGVLWYMPYIVISILTLPAGIYLCFGSVKLPQYLHGFSKISKEEKAIKNIKKYIRQRKSRIAVFTILLVFMIATSICMISIGNKLTRTMTPENIRLLAAANLMSFHYLLALFTGFIIGTLIIEISGIKRKRHMLTLNMWERIQELENEVKELKACTQEDNQNK